MKVIDPGHVYELDWLDLEYPIQPYEDDHKQSHLTFVKREGPGYPGNVGHHPGTNMQEVLRAVIDRLRYLHRQIPHEANEVAIMDLQGAIYALESRAAERHGRLERFRATFSPENIELQPTCLKCGHVGCDGSCHP